MYKRLTINFHGIDGIGKTTTITKTASQLSNSLEVKIKNWRPGLLPPLHRLFNRAPQITQVSESLVIPREKAGRFSVVRLLYYTVDFIFGAFLLDYSQKKAVIYDRSFLDLFVNPERFGIKPSPIINWIYRLVPKNKLNILLYANPNVVYSRKPELPLQTLAVHQYRWLQLFQSGKIEWPIYVNRSPDEIANEVVNLVTIYNLGSKIKEKNTASQQTEWLNGFFGNSTSTKKSNIMMLSFRDGRGFLIDNTKSNSLSALLAMYSPANRKAKWFKQLLALSEKWGLSLLFFKRITIDEDVISNFVNFVKNKIGYEGEISFGVSLGAPGPRRKLVFCIIDLNDNILAFAKLANHENAKIGLSTEAKTINYLKNKIPEHFEIPYLLYCGDWNGKWCCITTPIIQNNVNSQQFILSDNKLIEICSQLSKINYHEEAFEKSEFYQLLTEKISNIKTIYFKHLCEDALELILELAQGLPIPFHFAHGDFTPWNMIIGDSKIGLFDFEYALQSAPAGFDLIHYQLRKIILIDKKKSLISTTILYNKEVGISY